MYYQQNHVPNLKKTPVRSLSSKSPRIELLKMAAAQSGDLPPINRKENEQEQEMFNLISKNLLFD